MYDVLLADHMGQRYIFKKIWNIKILTHFGPEGDLYGLVHLLSYKVNTFVYEHLDFFIDFNLSILWNKMGGHWGVLWCPEFGVGSQKNLTRGQNMQ